MKTESRNLATPEPGHQDGTEWNPVGAELDSLSNRVRAHFEANKPDPTAFPAIAARVMAEAERPDVDIRRLATLLERDPALCAAVLRMANSALNRRASKVDSARSALMMLGTKRVADLAVATACRSLFDVEARVQYGLYPAWWNRLFHGAMTEAFCASFIGGEREIHASDRVFLTAMFLSIGKPLTLRSLSSVIIEGGTPKVPHDFAIDEVLRRNHVYVGGLALSVWNLPSSLREAHRRQGDYHVPARPEWVDTQVSRLVSSLNAIRVGTLHTEDHIRVLRDSSTALALDGEDVVGAAGHVSRYATQVAQVFGVPDDTDESGYAQFVERCMGDSPPL